jgi:hypothetical protein
MKEVVQQLAHSMRIPQSAPPNVNMIGKEELEKVGQISKRKASMEVDVVVPLNIYEKIYSAILYWVDGVVPLKRYWVGMQLEDAHRMINMGVSLRVKTAMKLMMRSASVMSLIIKDVTEDEEAKEDEGLEEESGGDA